MTQAVYGGRRRPIQPTPEISPSVPSRRSLMGNRKIEDPARDAITRFGIDSVHANDFCLADDQGWALARFVARKCNITGDHVTGRQWSGDPAVEPAAAQIFSYGLQRFALAVKQAYTPMEDQATL